jgi:hypothetical protein
VLRAPAVTSIADAAKQLSVGACHRMHVTPCHRLAHSTATCTRPSHSLVDPYVCWLIIVSYSYVIKHPTACSLLQQPNRSSKYVTWHTNR